MQAKMCVLYTKVLILLQLLHKQETWEQKVHVCDHQALYLVCLGKCLRKSVLKIFSCFCLLLLPITNILNVSFHIIQKNKNQGNTSWQTYSLSSTKSSVFFWAKLNYDFLDSYTARGILLSVCLSKNLTWNTSKPTKIWAEGKSIARS